jgi:hypothetical protein
MQEKEFDFTHRENFVQLLARQGISVDDCPDRLQLIVICKAIERLEEMTFSLQHDVKQLKEMMLEMRSPTF